MTEQLAPIDRHATAVPARGPDTAPGSPDRITIGLLAIDGIPARAGAARQPVDSALRRAGAPAVRSWSAAIYRTTVLERVLPAGSGPKDGTSVTQSSLRNAGRRTRGGAPATRVS